MNEKGQVIFYTLMIAICIIILAMALAPALKQSVEESRGNLDCSNDSISLFDKTTCIVTDVSIPAFIVGLIFIAGAIVTAKVVFAE